MGHNLDFSYQPSWKPGGRFFGNAAYYFFSTVKDGISVSLTHSHVEYFGLSSPNNMALKALSTAFTACLLPLEASPLPATSVYISSPLSTC